ncbi:MAG TPA: hypothetical protein VGP24_06215, partial [Glaciihabitans sp.]|nr:hypothetical protein [Glaciihabitans sp.]
MQSSSPNGSEPGSTNDYTRWLSAILLPFLAAASVILFVFPTNTEQLFSWTITPPLMAMVLGATYLGGIWFFVQVLRHKQWVRVAHGFPAVLVFATLLAIATLIHWDRFHHGHISFITWGILYATTPVLVLVSIVSNSRSVADASTPGVPQPQVPFVARMVLACIGFVALATGLTLFLIPAAFVDVWAWQLTPLTARVIGCFTAQVAVGALWLSFDRRWS